MSERPVKGRLPAFESLAVLEIAEGIAAPVCGLQLADLGATVIKVEPPEGDRCREWGPPMIGDTAAIFLHLNRGKQSAVLDLATDEGRAAMYALLPHVDAVLYHADPEVRSEHGLDWMAICDRFPRLVVVDFNDLGETGPLAGLAGSELVVQALSGFTRYVGEPGGEPCRVGFEIASVGAGLHAFQAVVAALLARDASGRGQVVRVGLLKALMSMKTILLAAQVEPDAWQGFHLNGPRWPADRGWRTRDGQVTFDFRHGQRAEWVQFCRAVGLDHLPDDPDYRDWRSTIQIGDRRYTAGNVYRPVFAQMTCREASDLVNGLGGISVKFNDYAETLANEQVRLLSPTIDVDASDERESRQLGQPLKFPDATQARNASAPRLGEHTAEVLARVGVRTAGGEQ